MIVDSLSYTRANAHIQRKPHARTINADWTVREGRVVRLHVSHSKHRRSYNASVLVHRIEEHAERCFPFDTVQLGGEPTARYSAKGLEQAFERAIASDDLASAIATAIERDNAHGDDF